MEIFLIGGASMEKLRNVITINDFNYSQGGASKVAIDTANLIADNGINSIFVSAVSDENRTTLNSKVIQYNFNGKEFINYSNKVKGMMRGLKCEEFSHFLDNILKKYNREDTVVHVHGWTKACSSDFFKILKKNGFRTFLTLHEYFAFCPNGAYFNYKKNIACKKKGCSIDCLLCNCDSRNYFFKIYRFIRELCYRKNIDFNYVHAIYISQFEKKIIENQYKIYNSSIVENPINLVKEISTKKKYDYIYIGRTSKEKGIELYLKMAQSMPQCLFLVVGEIKTNLENVIVTGWVSEQQVDIYLSQSRVLVFPSLWPETFGLNVIKALNAGIPCLVSSNTAAEDYVIDGINGKIFIQGSYNDLKDKAIEIENKTVINNASDKNYFKELIGVLDD